MDKAKAWSQPSVLHYFSKHRHEWSDLKPSEQVYLPEVLFPGIKVLDVGCGSGGLFNIMRTLEPTIDYTGIDIVQGAIKLARERYPEARFEVNDGMAIPFDEGTFDLVYCTSVLIHEPRYTEIWKEMYRVGNRYVLGDMRLLKDIGARGSGQDSNYKIQFDGKEQEATVPYVVSDADEVISFLSNLNPRPQALRGTGYFREVSKFTDTPFSQVCIAMLLLEKGTSKTVHVNLDLEDLPLEFAIHGTSPISGPEILIEADPRFPPKRTRRKRKILATLQTENKFILEAVEEFEKLNAAALGDSRSTLDSAIQIINFAIQQGYRPVVTVDDEDNSMEIETKLDANRLLLLQVWGSGEADGVIFFNGEDFSHMEATTITGVLEWLTSADNINESSRSL